MMSPSVMPPELKIDKLIHSEILNHLSNLTTNPNNVQLTSRPENDV